MAAQRRLVEHIIMNSSYGVEFKEEDGMRVTEKHLMGSGVGYTIIRNYRLRYDPIDPKYEGTARLTDDTMIAGGISREDLAVLMMTCLDGPNCENKIFHALDDAPIPNPALQVGAPQ